MDTRLSYLSLNLVPGIGSVLGRRLKDAFGSADRIFKTSADELSRIEGVGPELSGRIASFDLVKALNTEQESLARHGLDFITLDDPGYPESLKSIFDPPLVLYIKGSLRPEHKISLAIVGSRRSTIYGKSMARDLAAKLAGHGITIISGMARGIDTMAHRGALQARGSTIAVMGSGLDIIYPPENKSLMDAIASSGAVISEFPLGTAPFKQNFPLRNRIISGMTLGTLVVEAGEISGALITARLALEQGREVFAVPGPINSWASKGTNGLIKQGAKLVEDVEDIFEELGPHLGPVLFKNLNGKGLDIKDLPSRADTNLDPILKELIDGPAHIDSLIEKTGMPAQELLSRLIKLEMEGIIRQLPGNIYARV
ncbi:DNA-processing protein DprA [bacterium]|nr:DNA-processing protein DprA [bacterium]